MKGLIFLEFNELNNWYSIFHLLLKQRDLRETFSQKKNIFLKFHSYWWKQINVSSVNWKITLLWAFGDLNLRTEKLKNFAKYFLYLFNIYQDHYLKSVDDYLINYVNTTLYKV